MGEPYNIIVGVGRLYIGPAGEPKPDLDQAPAGNWRDLGDTEGGVKVRKTQTIVAFSSDQRTGKRKPKRTEEGLEIETNLEENTLENYGDVINATVTDTAPGSGTIGTRSLKPYVGATVTEYALLFRGESAYGPWPAQYYMPTGYMDEDVEMEFVKDGKTLIPIKFVATEDPDAATEGDRFGLFEEQDAAALP